MRITRKQAISIAQSYATVTGRKWKEDCNEVGTLTLDENDSGIELVEITNKGGGQRSVFGSGFNSTKNFYYYVSMAKQGIFDYKLSPVFIEHALMQAYNSASTPELKQSVIELVKDNIEQRCKRFIKEGKFETFGDGFMRLLNADVSPTKSIMGVSEKFSIKIGENSFSFVRDNMIVIYKATAIIQTKEISWIIE